MNTKMFLVAQLFSGQPWVERLGWTLVHFLWEGALIAAVYAVARQWVGQARSAQVRYVLACTALAAMVIAPIATFRFSSATDSSSANTLAVTASVTSALTIATPYSLASPPVFASRVWRDDVMPWLVVAWFVGAIVFWARLMGGWVVCARMRSILVRPAPVEWQRRLDGLRTRIRISRPVSLLVSALVQVPTVVGWLRPVVLVPLGALAGLHPDHVEALLAHELAHIRRHDYLVNVLQGIAEALLFYHPAVWWISGHIRNERELCCDDVAVAISGDALTYVRALADLESCRSAHFNPVLAANGGSVGERIARLLGMPRPVSNPPAASRVVAATVLVVVTAYALFGQAAPSKPARPSFEVASIEVASIRANNSPGENSVQFGSETLTFVHLPLANILIQAYGLPTEQMSLGRFEPQFSQRYDIVAKATRRVRRDQMVLMLQTLLMDRFHLAIHHEQRIEQGFALLAEKGRPKLQAPAAPDEDANFYKRIDAGVQTIQFRNAGMELLAQTLTEMADMSKLRPGPSPVVVNMTGIKGGHDFTLAWTREEAAAGDTEPPERLPAMVAGLHKLGLTVKSQRVPIDILVVDHIEKPSEN